MEKAEDWLFVHHETGGMWQERTRIVAKKLEVGRCGARILHSITRAMAHSNRKAEFALLDQLNEYRQLLNRYGMDCTCHYQALSEGIYSIDLVEEAMLILDIVDPPFAAIELFGSEGTFLAILAPNCSEI